MATTSKHSERRIVKTFAQETVNILAVENHFKGENPKALDYNFLVDSHDPVDEMELAGYAVENDYVKDISPDILKAAIKGTVGAIIRLASNGRPVTLDGLLSIRLVAKGGTNNPKLPFRENPNASLYFNATVSAALNQMANELSTHVEGVAPDRSIITSVFDPINESKTDYFRNGDIILEGHNIKIYPEKDPECGLTYINTNTGVAYPYTDTHVLNTPSKVISFIPNECPDGTYRIELRTKYFGGAKALKNVKVIKYDDFIEVITPTSRTKGGKKGKDNQPKKTAAKTPKKK